jgi:hypothetical protein
MVYSIAYARIRGEECRSRDESAERAKELADDARDSLPETMATMTIERRTLSTVDDDVVIGRGPCVDD